LARDYSELGEFYKALDLLEKYQERQANVVGQHYRKGNRIGRRLAGNTLNNEDKLINAEDFYQALAKAVRSNLYSLEELADYLQVSVRTVRNWLSKQRLPVSRSTINRHFNILKDL